MADGTICINAPVNERGTGYVTVSGEVWDYLMGSGMVIIRKDGTNIALRLYKDEMEG